jgi:hypothetical protein
MKYLPIFLILLLVVSCQQSRKAESGSLENSNLPLDGLIWTNLCSLEKWNENGVVKSYALRQVSQNFLLDNSGKIIATDLRGEDLINTLESLLN